MDTVQLGDVQLGLMFGGLLLGLSFDRNGAHRGVSFCCLLLAAVVFGITALYLSPRELGYGHVPGAEEEYTKRLEVGVAYRLFSSTKEGECEVLLVKKEGGSDMYAIRVKGPVPPERFTLVDGKPVAIK